MRVWLFFPCVPACRTTRWVLLASLLSLLVSACGGGTILVDSAEPDAGIKVTELAVGSPNCPSGGRAVTFGNTTQYVCSGNGRSAVVELLTLTAGELNCASGGWRVREGLDANGNGTLDSAEVAHTHSACSGGDGTASFNPWSNAISTGGFASLAAGTSDSSVVVNVDAAEWAITPAKGLMIVTLDNKAGASEAQLIPVELAP